MCTFDGWRHGDWIQLVQAVAAIAVVIAALFQDVFRSWFMAPDIFIRIDKAMGDLIPIQGDGKVLYYHLLLQNRGRAPALSASVVCTAYSRISADGRFVRKGIMPLKLAWPNQGAQTILDPTRGTLLNIVHNQYCDLGLLYPNSDAFLLSFEFGSLAFDGKVRAGEIVRIALEVRAENFQSKKPTCFEISWDGKWEDDRTSMAGHLKITTVDWSPERDGPDLSVFKTPPKPL